MPFVEKSHRDHPDHNIVGDLCYVEYRAMMDRWNANPRWTTAHEIYKNLKDRLNDSDGYFNSVDEMIAAELAWQVFFAIHVMSYEQEKRRLNGDI